MGPNSTLFAFLTLIAVFIGQLKVSTCDCGSVQSMNCCRSAAHISTLYLAGCVSVCVLGLHWPEQKEGPSQRRRAWAAFGTIQAAARCSVFELFFTKLWPHSVSDVFAREKSSPGVSASSARFRLSHFSKEADECRFRYGACEAIGPDSADMEGAQGRPDGCFDRSFSSLAVDDVYDIAKAIGTDVEKLIDVCGKENVAGLVPKIVKVLELLESFASSWNNKQNLREEELLKTFESLQLQRQKKRAGKEVEESNDRRELAVREPRVSRLWPREAARQLAGETSSTSGHDAPKVHVKLVNCSSNWEFLRCYVSKCSSWRSWLQPTSPNSKRQHWLPPAMVVKTTGIDWHLGGFGQWTG